MLSDLKVRKLKPGTTPYKVTDRDGLYLLVTPRGSRWWRTRPGGAAGVWQLAVKAGRDARP